MLHLYFIFLYIKIDRVKNYGQGSMYEKFR